MARFVAGTLSCGLLIVAGLYLLPAGGSGASLVWPAAAFGLALLLFGGLDLWPAVATAYFAVLVAQNVLPPLAATAALANSLEALAGAYLLREYAGFSPMLNRLRDALGLIGTAFAASAVSASVITLGASAFLPHPESLSALWGGVWIGHSVSILSFGAFFIRWMHRPEFTKTRTELLEGLLVFGTITVLLVFLFWTPYASLGGVSLLYVLILPLLWAALRTGPRGISLALFLMAAISSTGVLFGYGTIAHSPDLSAALFGVQLVIGALSVIFLLFTSVTEERKEAVQQLEGHVDQLQLAIQKLSSQDQAKTDFIAILAHEVRNPLSPLLSGLELLKARNEGPDDVVRMMGAHLHTIARLLDDLLDISRISQKKFKVQKEPVELRDAVESAVEMVRPALKERGHELSVDLPQEAWLDADPVRLGQVLANLLSNAAKYTDRGGRIELSATREGDDLVISVKDNGIGIDPQYLPKVFDAFGEFEGGGRRPGGLHIGLALAKRMVEMHRGEIAVHSGGEGKGTLVVVRLPALPSAPLPLPAGAPPQRARFSRQTLAQDRGRNRRILVVDDNAPAAETLAMLLRQGGHEVAVARDGAGALALKDFCPRVALLDIGLPDMDGYELGRRLRAQCGAGLRLIALSGYGQGEDKQKAKDAGFEDYLVKPVSIVDVELALSKLA